MATTIKKGAKNPKAKPSRPVMKTSPAKQAQTIAKLRQELEARDRELAEALEQQTATGEILRVIASSSTDVQPVLDKVAENAARLCNANDALIFRVEGDVHRRVAAYGHIPTTDFGMSGPNTRGNPVGRAIVDRRTIHVRNIVAELETEFPEYRTIQIATGTRTTLSTPLLRNDEPLGVIHIRRTEVRPFTEEQIKLLETFANQAVIAIENARLLQELTHRTGELELSNLNLTEALEQQTATSEILGVIASSPNDIRPVLSVVAETAAKLCEATDASILRVDGENLRLAASFGSLDRVAEQRPLSRSIPGGRAVIDRETIHVHDLHEQLDEFPSQARTRGMQGGTRTVLATPLFREHSPIGAIVIRRTEVCPFTDKQIALLKTFADQAVIAIENVRLFQELTEALEQQTATSEILGVIASSPTDIQPVLDVVAASAARLWTRMMQ